MKRRVILTVAALLAVTTGSFARELPRPGAEDARVRFVEYRPFDVVRIVGTLRSSVQVEFAADEDIAQVALGNTVAWEVAVAGNIMFLKAREKQPVTNAQVVTTLKDGSRRSYQFEVVIADDEKLDETYFYVKFRYAADEAAARAKALMERRAVGEVGRVDTLLAQEEVIGPRNWHYTAKGSAAIEPAQVYDNGKLTVFVFRGQQEVPAIFLVNSDGSETLVPKSVDGDLVRVHATSAKFILRRGKDVLGIYNEAFNPMGAKTGTNTTATSVERVVDGSGARAAGVGGGKPDVVAQGAPATIGLVAPTKVTGPNGTSVGPWDARPTTLTAPK